MLAGALAFGLVKAVQVHDARAAGADTRAELANHKTTIAESERLAARARTLELERINSEQRKAVNDAAKQTRIALGHLPDARSAGDRLRKQIAFGSRPAARPAGSPGAGSVRSGTFGAPMHGD
ncbi:hypothetical protein [Variovorax sp. PBL-H6]|uniref:hypothetical protein n=1 Tax=Variovorax sp. PBL-H6 TaxID=434009 RepID=UPI0013A594C0|nr:hypothetical protein [Variovorax sp. PBL-H6]